MSKKTTLTIALLGCAIAALAAFASSTKDKVPDEPIVARNTAIQLGTVEMKNGTTDVTVAKAALDVDAGANTPELKGKVKNSTPDDLDDVTIIIEDTGTGGGPPPIASSAKVTQAAGSSSANFTAVVGGGWKAKINLSSPGSGKIIESWQDRLAARIKNVDTGRDITSFSCEMSLPTGVTISSVTLQDPDDAFATVNGSSASIDVNEFTVTGFTLAHDEYELVVVYSEVPGGETWLEVEATFAEE